MISKIQGFCSADLIEISNVKFSEDAVIIIIIVIIIYFVLFCVVLFRFVF